MLGYDPLGHRQTQPETVFVGRKKRIEDLIDGSRRNTSPLILNCNNELLVRDASGYFDFPAIRRRLDGIHYKIAQDLCNLFANPLEAQEAFVVFFYSKYRNGGNLLGWWFE